MFDVSWSELLILGVVTLIFVGPKELPRFLGTLGKYAGVVRRQANEFRSVFEQAMREAEMEDIKKEVRAVSDGVKATLDDATRSVTEAKAAAEVDADAERRILPKAAEFATSAPDVADAEAKPLSGSTTDASSGDSDSSGEAPSAEADGALPPEPVSDTPSRPV
jgi:sec-independent protein translocase protein TatB